jgi:hypothetical protein
MFCGNCGKEIEEGTKFCTHCGCAISVVLETVELRCSACGTVLKEGVEFCGNCGNKINNVKANSNQDGHSVNATIRVRHGFTLFYLICGIIFCFIGGVFNIYSYSLVDPGVPIGPLFPLLYVISSMIGAACYILLLRWKKIGFWIFIGIAFISLLLNIQARVNISPILLGLSGIVGLWGVLHIRKNGKTTWEQLE